MKYIKELLVPSIPIVIACILIVIMRKYEVVGYIIYTIAIISLLLTISLFVYDKIKKKKNKKNK